MKIVGLTGGIACGKSTVAEMFGELGASVVDADQISHELTSPGGDALPALREAFGDFVFYPDGALNRAVLASMVFQNDEERAKLNAATHPLIHKRMLQEIETCRKMGALVVVLDVPLLFEAGVDDLADVTLCVSAPEARQIERLKTRGGLTREQALSRIRSQWPLEEKEKRSDIILNTDRPVQEVRADVQRLFNAWISAGV